MKLTASYSLGNFQYQRAFGCKSLASPAVPLPIDATFWLASATKLLTSIAALQLVERGLVNLDDDVSSILVELKDKEVLTGFDEHGKPILKKAENKITLRQEMNKVYLQEFWLT